MQTDPDFCIVSRCPYKEADGANIGPSPFRENAPGTFTHVRRFSGVSPRDYYEQH